jgi:hypothetical protein
MQEKEGRQAFNILFDAGKKKIAAFQRANAGACPAPGYVLDCIKFAGLSVDEWASKTDDEAFAEIGDILTGGAKVSQRFRASGPASMRDVWLLDMLHTLGLTLPVAPPARRC